jgi:hypothetical protein
MQFLSTFGQRVSSFRFIGVPVGHAVTSFVSALKPRTEEEIQLAEARLGASSLSSYSLSSSSQSLPLFEKTEESTGTCPTEGKSRMRRTFPSGELDSFIEHHSTTIAMPSGLQVFVRPIRPSDQHGMREGMGRLSEKSKLMRFLTTRKELSERELKYLCDVDYHNHFAFVAIIDRSILGEGGGSGPTSTSTSAPPVPQRTPPRSPPGSPPGLKSKSSTPDDASSSCSVSSSSCSDGSGHTSEEYGGYHFNYRKTFSHLSDTPQDPSQWKHQMGAGVARFIRDQSDPTVAEMAVTVLDRFHGHGIGLLLVYACSYVAEATGITRLRALVHPGNKQLQRWLHRVSVRSFTSDEGDRYFELPLPLPEPTKQRDPDGTLYSAVRFAATGQCI